MKRLFLLVIVFGIIGLKLTFPQTAFACGGAVEYGPVENSIEAATIIVEAVVTGTDDADQNAILKVTSYLVGGPGPDAVLLYDVDPALSAVHAHGYSTGCEYGGSLYDSNSSPSTGMYGYFMLERATDGSYRFVSTSSRSFVELNEIDDFEALVAELRAEELTAPQDTPPVILSPLRITMNDGQQYMLPVDSGALIPYTPTEKLNNWTPYAYPNIFSPVSACTEIGCRMYVQDRSLFAEIAEENHIIVDYPYSDLNTSSEENPYQPITLEGQAFSFSPTGETMIAWNQDYMIVYMISSSLCMCPQGVLQPSLIKITEYNLATRRDFEPMTRPWDFVRWSADGSTLAFSDAAGLSIIDVFRQRRPERVISNTGGAMPVPVVVSTTGRYIGYTFDLESHAWTTLDRLEGNVFSNALPSPDEHYFAYFADANGVFAPRPDFEASQCYFLPCATYEIPQPDYFQWIERDGITYSLSIRCGENQRPASSNDGYPAYCELKSPIFNYQGITRPFSDFTSRRADEIRNFIYHPHIGLAYIIGPQSLNINGTDYDFSDQIEGEIVDIAWLPSLFYHRH